MTKYLIILALVTVVLGVEKYSTKYDDVDVDKILRNDRVLTNYIRCMLDEGSCTAEGRELKKILPDALATDCTKCNERQKITAEKVINHLKTKRSKDWDRLITKYDPQGEYKQRFENLRNSKKI
ncbi:ejaculatory bulb-specific protein 3-like [Vespa crabro]|uniref:ejaculatory bulb-specific protein 3-like n=1 Tax=Vespa crabro TaxID=7445 RepID=UPI001EFFDEDB|nr:ejaculatory bulb-specific protein 3-like [Vespa crabro]XP_046823972.1 ejaculatory bulb-specific protein 3-like [Vespa crabro]